METLKVIGYFVFLYLTILGAAYYLQEKIIFFPETLNKEYDFKLPLEAKEYLLTTQDGIKINALLYQRPANKKIIIYFHGNAGSLADWKGVAPTLLSLGCNVFIIDYRGYGKSEGKFSEAGFYLDGEAAYQFIKDLGYKDNQIIFYGRSLGSGIAIEMASKHKVKALILETPFLSFTHLALQRHWFLLPRILLRYKFDNVQKIKQLNLPILIMHGQKDELIPVEHSYALSKKIKYPHQLVILPQGQHNDLDTYSLYAETLKDFLSQL